MYRIRIIASLLVSTFCLIVVSTMNIVIAQDDDANAPETYVYLLQNNQLTALDLITGEQEIVSNLSPMLAMRANESVQTDRRFWSADIDPTGQIIYQIEAWGRSTNPRILNLPIGADLLQINLETNTQEVIFDRTSVFNFVLSPDGERMIVFYYAGEYLYSTQHACVLDLQTRDCTELNFNYVGAKGFWLDNDTFIIGTDDTNPLQLVDANDGSSITLFLPLEWYINWATSIPGTNSLLLSVLPRELSDPNTPVSFLIYDLETSNVNLLPYTAPNTRDYFTVGDLELSPDGNYLLYQGSSASLVEFNSGTLIQQFSYIATADWLDSQTLLVHGARNADVLEIIRFDLSSGQVTVLASGEAASGVLLVP